MFNAWRFLAFLGVCALPCYGTSAVQSLSLEEKVGQLLMAHFHGEVANEDARALIQDTKIGGIIYYNWSNGLDSPKQVHLLSAGLQKLVQKNQNPIPLFIAADQEGGVVARLSRGFTVFPGNKALGMTGEPHLAEAAAWAMGKELQAVGINMNLAPVVDVNTNPRNPVIGIRAYGDHPETVIAFGEKALSGYKKAKIMTTLKHFPGHGDVEVDSHEDLPMVHKALEILEQGELLPFARLASSAEAIMTAHILMPALDSENCVTLSNKALTYLRNKIGFQGVIIADSLVMEGVLKRCDTIDEAAIQALNAGCDILLLGGKQLIGGHSHLELTVGDVQRVHRSIVKAVDSGRISESRLNQALEKILKLKEHYLSSQTSDLQAIGMDALVNTAEHQMIARQIARLALKTIKNDALCLTPLPEKKVCIFAPHVLRDAIHQTSLLSLGKSTDVWFFSTLSPSGEEVETAKQRAETADVLLVCSYNAWKNPSQAMLIQSLLDTGKPLILLATRDPLDAYLFPRAHLVLNTFSPTPVSIQAASEFLGEKY